MQNARRAPTEPCESGRYLGLHSHENIRRLLFFAILGKVRKRVLYFRYHHPGLSSRRGASKSLFRHGYHEKHSSPLAGTAPGIVVVLTAETPHTRHPHSTRPSVTVHVQMHHDSTLRCVHPTVDCRMLSSARKRIRQGSPGFFDLIRLRRV